jgi:hypothetical protein
MRIIEIVQEARSSDREMSQRYPEMTPDELEFMGGNFDLPRDPGPTLWSCRAVIENILGTDLVTGDEHRLKPGMYYMFDGVKEPFFRPTGDTNAEAGSIELPDLDSHAARDVGAAAHEAYHAYVHNRSPGQAYGNEKIVNNLAERWLRKHLSGASLHYALEAITKSRIDYGTDHTPKGPVTDRR